MREIKYRQFVETSDDEWGNWHYWGYIDGHWFGPISGKEYADKNQEYTGLLDKNGKKIWEGDIVREIWSLHVVEWSQGDCGFRPFTGTKHLNALNCEVIGNVWESRGLLEEKDV